MREGRRLLGLWIQLLRDRREHSLRWRGCRDESTYSPYISRGDIEANQVHYQLNQRSVLHVSVER